MTITIATGDHQTVVVATQQPKVITTGIMPPPPIGMDQIANMIDVNLAQLVNGSVLVYNTSTSKWVSTTSLSQQNIDCGEF